MDKKENIFAYKMPHLLKEWDFKKNKELSPYIVTYGSGKMAWWICEEGHKWETRVADRKKHGCPYCSGRLVNEQNCLATTHPELSSQWHPTKNKELTPQNISFGSTKKVWWICEKEHEWEVSPNARTGKATKPGGISTGCPTCSDSAGTSFPEQSLFYYIKTIFPDSENRHFLNKLEVDIYIPSLSIAIEYDGGFYHKDLKRDLRKQKKLFDLFPDLKLIRIREKECPTMPIDNKTKIIRRTNKSTRSLNEVIKKTLSLVCKEHELTVDVENDKPYIMEQINHIEYENSLQNKYPLIASEWHPAKNGNLTPKNVRHSSNQRAWWKCNANPEHEWNSIIQSRSKDSHGCPYCSGRFPTAENNLAVNNPKLIHEWHPLKNGELTPYQVTPKSKKKVWWICKLGHEWDAQVKNRNNGSTCPSCSGKILTEHHNLQIKNPSLASEWHLTKNGELTPSKITPNNKKKVWWLCQEGHEWEAQVGNRNRGTKCPTCSRKNRSQK